MAQQIKKKFIGNDQVDGTKVLLNNDEAIRSKDFLGVDQDILKLDASDKVVAKNGLGIEEIAFKSQVDAEAVIRGANDDILQTNINAVAGDLDIAEGQITVLQGEMDAVEADIVGVNTELGSIQSAASALEIRVTTAESDIVALETGKVSKSGDAMQGSLDFGGVHKVEGLADGTLPSDAVNKGQLDSAIDVNVTSKLGQPDGIAPLNGSAKIDALYLPSYVDDVLEFADFASFPIVGETGKIYVTLDTNKTYRWTGTVYIEISASEVTSVNNQTDAVQINAIHVPVTTILGVTGSDVQGVLEDLKSQIDGAVAGSDSKQIKVSANDTTEGYLENKVIGVLGDIEVSTLNDGGNEQLQISIGSNIASKAHADAGDTATLSSANSHTDTQVAAEATARIAADLLLDGKVTDLESDLADHIAQAVGAHAASAISVSPAIPDVAGGDVQTVLGNMKSYIDSADTALQNQINAITGAATPTWFKESFAITTNSAPSTVTLTHAPIANSVVAFVDRLAIHEGVGADYTISETTLEILNPGQGNNQIGNGDTIYVTYQYLA